MNKIYVKAYNCFYCKTSLSSENAHIHWLEKDGQKVTKLILCKECKETIINKKK